MATGSYQDVELEHYHALKQNGSLLYDVIIKSVKVMHPSGWSSRVDIGISLEPEANRRSALPVATIKEIGDLSTHAGLQVIDGSARRVSHAHLGIEKRLPFGDLLDLLQLYYRTP